MAAGTIIAYLLGGTAIVGLLQWRFPAEALTSHGSARFGNVWDLVQTGRMNSGGIDTGEWAPGLNASYRGPHAITFGDSGCGKGTSVILPNLLTRNRIFLIDPGGENTAVACKYWRDQGYEFRCINPFGLHTAAPWSLPMHGFNPLATLNPAADDFASKARVLAEMLVLVDPRDTGATAYFKSAARNAVAAFLMHIRANEPRERQTLGVLYHYVNSEAKGWSKLIAAMRKHGGDHVVIRNEANKLERVEAQSPEEFSGIMSTVQDALSFLADPVVRRALRTHEADFWLLKGHDANVKGAVISVILPLEYIESHAALLRLAMSCGVFEFLRAPIASERILVLIDEAAALGKLAHLSNWLATLRKYNVSIWTIWQSASQLADLYGVNWHSIVSNCGLLQILGIGDQEMAAQTEKLLGQCTIKVTSTSSSPGNPASTTTTETGRALMFSDEVRRMATDKLLVIMDNQPPFLLTKRPYYERPELEGRYYANPHLGYLTAPDRADRLRLKLGGIYRGLVWWMTPHPFSAACMLGGMVLLWMGVT